MDTANPVKAPWIAALGVTVAWFFMRMKGGATGTSSPGGSSSGGSGGSSSGSSQGGSKLGLRALEVARSQLGVKEATGRNDGEVQKYFKGTTRLSLDSGKEQPTGWEPGWDWCAAFASWCGYEAATMLDKPPHGRRIAVWELIEDARKNGRFEDVSAWGSGPRPGDLVVWKRKGDPRGIYQSGHVSRCVSWDGKKLVTIGGNEDNQVREADVTADLPNAVGVIRY